VGVQRTLEEEGCIGEQRERGGLLSVSVIGIISPSLYSYVFIISPVHNSAFLFLSSITCSRSWWSSSMSSSHDNLFLCLVLC